MTSRVLLEFGVEVEGAVNQPLFLDMVKVALLVVPIDHGGHIREHGTIR